MCPLMQMTQEIEEGAQPTVPPGKWLVSSRIILLKPDSKDATKQIFALIMQYLAIQNR